MAPASIKTTINVDKIQNIGRGKFKVKIRQTDIHLTNMTHLGKFYQVLKDLGRGRYIMKLEAAT